MKSVLDSDFAHRASLAIGSGDTSSMDWLIAEFSPILEARIRLRTRGLYLEKSPADLVSEIWERTLQKWDELRETKDPWRALRAYLFRTLRSVVVDSMRRRDRAPVQLISSAGGTPAWAGVAGNQASILTRALRGEKARKIVRGIGQLEESEQQILFWFLQGHTAKEVARIARSRGGAAFRALTEESARKRWQRVVERLRGQLADCSQ